MLDSGWSFSLEASEAKRARQHMGEKELVLGYHDHRSHKLALRAGAGV